MRLQGYFTKLDVRRALDAFAKYQSDAWPPSMRLKMYGAAKQAFEDGAPAISAQRVFEEEVYEPLRTRWKVFRGKGADDHWDAATTHQVMASLPTECRALSLVDLAGPAGISPSASATIGDCLRRMTDLKRNTSGYPWVAVSKFLHFHNPKLFPVYDIEVVWKCVLNGAFRTDYKDFCARHGYAPGERSWRFNLMYTHLAAECLARRACDVMPGFATWFSEQTAGHRDPHDVQSEVHTYYSAAFELVAIGAAILEGWVPEPEDPNRVQAAAEPGM